MITLEVIKVIHTLMFTFCVIYKKTEVNNNWKTLYLIRIYLYI